MPVGFPTKVNYATGDVLSATNMNDLSGTVNLLESAQYAAGKNKIINGDFGVWQRGTSFVSPTSGAYTADRWRFENNGTGTVTISQQAFTPGTAPAAPYESTFFLRMTTTAVGTSTAFDVTERIEDVTTLAGQTATISFWAKADSARTIQPIYGQGFGTGGSSTVFTFGTAITLTTSWARYTQTIAVPSISGKTVGTSSYLQLFLRAVSAASLVIDIWGVQLEAASVASPFQTATGTKQGELAACQRYYYRNTAPGTFAQLGGNGPASTSSIIYMAYNAPVPLRVTPTSVDFGGDLRAYDGVNYITVTSVATSGGINNNPTLQVNSAAGFTTLRPYFLSAQAVGNAYIGFSAEL